MSKYGTKAELDYSTTPAQLTADQNNYDPTSGVDIGVWRLSSDASRTITGIRASQAETHFWIINVGSNDIVLSNQDAASTAANRIITGTGASITVAADEAVHLWYDSTTARWRIL